MTTKTFSNYLTKKEQKGFFSAIKAAAGWVAKRDYHMFWLMRLTGMRVGTLVGLTVRDAQEAIAGTEMVFRPEISKRKRGYAVPMTQDIEKHLKGLLLIRRDRGLDLDPDSPLVIARVHSRGGEGITARSVQMRMEHWRGRSGITVPATPHWLRHTLGQRLVRDSTARNPLVTAQLALGHSSLDSTAIYTRPTREEMSLAMREAAA